MWDHSFAQLFDRGGLVMWPLLGFSVVATSVALERFVILLWRYVQYDQFLAECREFNSPELAEKLQRRRHGLAKLAAVFLAHRQVEAELLRKLLEREASIQITQLERRLDWLSIIGSLAPMLGLLGTVIGLVDAFHQIELLGGQVQPGNLAAGIWKALLTTVFGLIVGIPTLAAYHFLDQRIGARALEMDWFCVHLEKLSILDKKSAPISSPDELTTPGKT